VPRSIYGWISILFAAVLTVSFIIGIYGCAFIYLRRKLGVGARDSWFERAFDRLNGGVERASEVIWKRIRIPLAVGFVLLLLAWLAATVYLPYTEAGAADQFKASAVRSKVADLLV
jgi:hypothetical protein